jgi:hypothetical protein
VLDEVEPAYLVDMEDYRSEFLVGLAKAKKIALETIQQAQAKQKEFYDRQAGNPQYRLGERVMVYMPGDVTGKSWKLARPYHGPFRILSLMPTNAEVQLIEKPGDPSLFVALGRLRRCYPEMTDTSWTGRKKRNKTRKRVALPQIERAKTLSVRREGPITRSMARAQKD